MNVSSSPWRSALKRWPRYLRPTSLSQPAAARVSALVIVLAYLALSLAAYRSTLQTPWLGIRVAQCGGDTCLTWVMPGSHAWDQGARPGMVVVSAGGQSPADLERKGLPLDAAIEAGLRSSSGEELDVQIVEKAIGRSPLKFSLWGIGTVFALLGALVLVRRPDVPPARVFGVFSAFTALAFAVGPASGGPAPQWALVAQIIVLLAIGATFCPLAVVLNTSASRGCRLLTHSIFAGIALAIGAAYGVSLMARPTWYQTVQPALFLYVAASALGAIGYLAFQAMRSPRPETRQQMRTVLVGIAVSALPFVSMSLIPEAVGQGSLLPIHLTVLPLGLMPVFFAYSILQRQLFGIRTLVHRGMVYGIVAVALAAVLSVGVATIASGHGPAHGPSYVARVSLLLAAGILAFFPLRQGARWLVDNLIYRDVVNYEEVVDTMRDTLLKPEATAQDLAQVAVNHLARAVRLESALLFLGSEPALSRLVASAGERAQDILENAYPRFKGGIQAAQQGDLAEFRLGSEFLLLANMRSSGRYLGFILMGPKSGGDAFTEDEKRRTALIAASFLAVALDKAELSEGLRHLNRRLLKAGETERARIAGDIHDGPLQKAMMLAAADNRLGLDRSDLARQLSAELREICWRLRPSVLDDLGLIPALEWLLDGVAKRSGLSTSLALDDINDEARFLPDLELALFRVTQEATNNVIKHAKATSVTVSLFTDGDGLTLTVQDDGVGLKSNGLRNGGFGLDEMRERMVQLNGSLDIESSPGLGTTVVARAPLSAEAGLVESRG